MTDYDFIPTMGGRGQRHPHGLVGKVWRIKTPQSVRVGDCFLSGRLKEGDLFLCINHSGDCFQDYIFLDTYNYLDGNKYLKGFPQWRFGSYGIGDAEECPLELSESEIEELKTGGDGVRISTGSIYLH